MKIKITKPGIYGNDGEIAVGTELDVKEEPKGWVGRYEVISGGNTEGKTPVVNPAVPSTGYAVTEKSPGWFVVTKDGEPATKAMRKSDLDGFEAMSDEDKGAFVELQKPEA